MAFATGSSFDTLNADLMKKIALISLLVLSSCSRSPQGADTQTNARPNLQPGFDAISSDSLLSEIKTLSSDEFEGRKPGSAGEQKTIAYMQQQFQQMGLKPGNPDGTYLQNVPLAGITSKTQADLSRQRQEAAAGRQDGLHCAVEPLYSRRSM